MRIKTFIFCILAFGGYGNALAQTFEIFNFSAPEETNSGNFQISWNVQHGNPMYSACSHFEIEIFRNGSLYLFEDTGNCSVLSYNAVGFPEGVYEIMITSFFNFYGGGSNFYPGPIAQTIVGSPEVTFGTSFENGLGRWTNVAEERFLVKSRRTTSGGTGPSGPSVGDYYAFVETSSPLANTAGDTAILESPTFEATGGELEFDYHMYGS